MTRGFALFWLWLVHTFGALGAVLIVALGLAICLGWIVTPVWVWLLYRKSRVLERHVIELRDFQGSLSRREKVERLQRDRERTNVRPRRRS